MATSELRDAELHITQCSSFGQVPSVPEVEAMEQMPGHIPETNQVGSPSLRKAFLSSRHRL
jgi:hypothetical protein